MKVVFCKKCNAKYQLDDMDDISDYECTVCDGDLEIDNDYVSNANANNNANANGSDSNTKSKSSANIFSKSKDKYDIVYCNDCSLKYRIGKNENVSNYECDVCDGELSYVDENLNSLVNVKNKHNTDENNIHNTNNNSDSNININAATNANNTNTNSDATIATDSNTNNTNDGYNSYEVETDRFENSIEFVRSRDKSKEKERIREAILSGSLDDGFISPVHNDNGLNSHNSNSVTNDNNSVTASVTTAAINDTTTTNTTTANNSNFNSNSKTSKTIKNDLVSDDEFEDFEQAKYNKIKNIALVNFSDNLDKVYSIPIKSSFNNSNSNSNSNLVSNSNKDIPTDNISKNDANGISHNIANNKNNANNNANNNFNTNINTNNRNADSITANNDSKISNNSKTELSSKNKGKSSKKDVVSNPKVNRSFYDYFIIAGLIVALLGFSDFVLTSRPYGVIFIGIGIGIFAYGVYLNKKNHFAEKRSRIIREALLTLPSNFYVLYYLKIPNSNAPINHVVIGPTGVFTILTQKYASKEKSELKQDDETLELINNLNDNETISSKKELTELLGTKKPKNQESNEESFDTSKNAKTDTKTNSGTSINTNGTKGSKNNKSNVANQTKFELDGAGEIKFDTNNKIKQKSVLLASKVSEFLEFNEMPNIYIEPFIGFANDNIAIINAPLSDEDLFIDELLTKISQGPVKISHDDVNRCAVLLANYSAKCSS
ncbi:MAG: hypothetical protein ACRC1M_07565 [Methanobacteriaceae archaeon]